MNTETKIGLLTAVNELKLYADHWELPKNTDSIDKRLALGTLMVSAIRRLSEYGDQL